MAGSADIILDRAKSYFKTLVANVLIIYGEKGIAPFKRPLVIAVPTLLVLYVAVYSPIAANLSKTTRSISGMIVVSQFAEQYEVAKLRIQGLHRRLPLIKDKDEWLSYVINSTARDVGVQVDSLSAQRENEVANYVVVSREVQTSTTYHVFGKWLAEIENSPIFLRVTDVSLQRDEASPGMVKVTFTLSTVFPRFGAGGGG
jgi:type II secretory pathway component PulM